MLFVVLLTTIGVYAQTSEVLDNDLPEITFKSTEVDYGSVSHNSDGVRFFEFINTGKTPLLLTNVSASCGCTIVEWKKEPIKPGDKGTITIKYNTTIYGPFNKSIRVFSNAKVSPILLIIKGEVKAVMDGMDKNQAIDATSVKN